jgi:PAS domain S-box-containing protein
MECFLYSLLDAFAGKRFPALFAAGGDTRAHMTEHPVFTDELMARTILAANSEAVVASDREGVIRFWNLGAERIFGYSAAEVLGQSLDLIIPERLRARHWHGYRQVMVSGESRYSAGDLLSVPALRKDRSQLSVEFTITPIRLQNELIGLVAVMRDVTARFEETKALRQKLRALTNPSAHS